MRSINKPKSIRVEIIFSANAKYYFYITINIMHFFRHLNFTLLFLNGAPPIEVSVFPFSLLDCTMHDVGSLGGIW